MSQTQHSVGMTKVRLLSPALSSLIVSVGTTGDSSDNALAEAVNGAYKAEAIHNLKENWAVVSDGELSTLECIDCFNKMRFHSTIFYVSSFEIEKRYYDTLTLSRIAA